MNRNVSKLEVDNQYLNKMKVTRRPYQATRISGLERGGFFYRKYVLQVINLGIFSNTIALFPIIFCNNYL